jgi:acetyl/propionyl-CoA carboxylase alpha subunit
VKLERVLIATRGVEAQRLLRHYRDRGVETALAFAEAEADASYLDDADYAVWLNGRTVAETWLHPQRVVEAAMDAGADAIHPGTHFLATHLGLYQLAGVNNLAVIGADPRILAQIDRLRLRRVARELGLPTLPGSGALAPGEDGIAAAAQVGFPLVVQSVRGRVLARVAHLDALPDALARVRGRGALQAGERGVYLERAVDGLRSVGVTIAADRHGAVAALGCSEALLEHRAPDGTAWLTAIEAFGAEVESGLDPGILAASRAVGAALGWAGVARVRWAVTPDGGWFLSGFSGRLTAGFGLVEAVHGIDLLDAQWRCLTGEPLGWDPADCQPTRTGVEVRLLHVDPATGGRPAGVLASLELPAGGMAGVEVGMALDEDTEPILGVWHAVADDLATARAHAAAGLDAVDVGGVPTNRAALAVALSGARDAPQG